MRGSCCFCSISEKLRIFGLVVDNVKTTRFDWWSKVDQNLKQISFTLLLKGGLRWVQLKYY